MPILWNTFTVIPLDEPLDRTLCALHYRNMKTNAQRANQLRKAIEQKRFTLWNGRQVGLPRHIAQLTGVSPSTICTAHTKSGVKTYLIDNCVLFIDVEDLLRHFETAKPGPKPRRQAKSTTRNN